MKNHILLIALLLSSTLSIAQISFKTGDSNFDAELNIVNKEAESDLSTFKKNLSNTYNLTTNTIDGLLKIMEPAEVFLSAKIAQISNNPIDKVVASYKVNKDKGWGQIAKEMGIKPGSAEFHALKGKEKKGNGNSKSKGNSKGKGKSK